jgi:hypothetical protein
LFRSIDGDGRYGRYAATLDNRDDRLSILFMRVILLLLTALGLAQANAQQKQIQSSVHQDSSTAQIDRLVNAITDEELKAQTEIPISKKVKVGGPLAGTFKAKKVLDVPRRILKLLNPFSPNEPDATIEVKHNVSTRAWATTVGLHPGRSAFPDVTTHEPTMTLVTVGR